mgnify:CR=1 FL=1
MSPPDFDFSEVLRRMVETRASDVHITAGFPPAIREKGAIHALEGFPVLNSQQTREIVYGILNDDQRKRFENSQQLDFAYAIPGVARFRVNCFFQRGSVSAAFRLIPQEIPGVSVIQFLRQALSNRTGVDYTVLELRLKVMEAMSELGIAQCQREPLEQRLQREVDGAIDHQAERALVVVLADVGERPREVRICHVGHGDQEVMRQIDRGHALAPVYSTHNRLRGAAPGKVCRR